MNRKTVKVWNGEMAQSYKLKEVKRSVQATVFVVWSSAWNAWVDMVIKDSDSWKIMG